MIKLTDAQQHQTRTFHVDNKATVVVALRDCYLQVGFAYLSDNDHYSRKLGRAIAMNRAFSDKPISHMLVWGALENIEGLIESILNELLNNIGLGTTEFVFLSQELRHQINNLLRNELPALQALQDLEVEAEKKFGAQAQQVILPAIPEAPEQLEFDFIYRGSSTPNSPLPLGKWIRYAYGKVINTGKAWYKNYPNIGKGTP